MKLKQAVILVIFLTLAVPSILQAQDDEDQQSPEQVAYIRLIEGEVGYQRGDDSQAQWSAAVINTPLMPGDSLYANDRGRAEIQLGDRNFLRVGKQGYIGLLKSDDRTFQFKVASGTATLRLRRLDRNYEIDTPNFAFSVQRPGEYRVDVNANGDAEITLYKGRGVASMAERGEEELAAPARLNVANGSAEFTISKRLERDDWDEWNRRRDGLDYDTRPRYVPPGVYGYESMSGYGRWVQSEAYGPVWIPAMGADWQPYRLGRWVWVDPFGWTWVSYEAWGWAPYHYGRWASIEGVGWAWVPGPPTVRQRFAAALVAFVSGNEGGAWVGWFPLGPGEVYQPYVSREVYVARPVRQYVNYNYVTVVNRTEIYNSTTVVYNTRIVDRQVIERTQVVTHCDITPSRETLYTPAVHVTGNQVVAVSNRPQPAPRPTERIIQRNVRVRTGEVPTVRKFDDKLEEMQRAGVVRPVNPYQPAQPVATVNREPGNSAHGAKAATGKPNPPGNNEGHGRSAGVPPGLFNKNVPAANSSVTGPASVPPATRNAPAAQAPAAAEDQPRPRYQPPATLEGRNGRPANTPQVQEQARPKYEPPQEVEHRMSQPRTAEPGGEQPKLAVPPGQANGRRTDEPQPVAPPHEHARPAYQPPQQAEGHANRPEAEPAKARKPDQPSWAPPAAARAQQSTSTQPTDTATPHQAARATGPTRAENGAQPDSHSNGHQPPKAVPSAQQAQQSRQAKQADSPRPPKSESKQKPSEDEGKGKN
jgi:hypothetical protein